eukprot:scaffold407_cov251-Pinguiococcus_pyrenoidosus.AAC.45
MLLLNLPKLRASCRKCVAATSRRTPCFEQGNGYLEPGRFPISSRPRSTMNTSASEQLTRPSPIPVPTGSETVSPGTQLECHPKRAKAPNDPLPQFVSSRYDCAARLQKAPFSAHSRSIRPLLSPPRFYALCDAARRV